MKVAICLHLLWRWSNIKKLAPIAGECTSGTVSIMVFYRCGLLFPAKSSNKTTSKATIRFTKERANQISESSDFLWNISPKFQPSRHLITRQLKYKNNVWYVSQKIGRRRSDVLIVNFEKISHIVLVFLLIADFEQVNVGWEEEKYNESKHSLSNYSFLSKDSTLRSFPKEMLKQATYILSQIQNNWDLNWKMGKNWRWFISNWCLEVPMK